MNGTSCQKRQPCSCQLQRPAAFACSGVDAPIPRNSQKSQLCTCQRRAPAAIARCQNARFCMPNQKALCHHHQPRFWRHRLPAGGGLYSGGPFRKRWPTGFCQTWQLSGLFMYDQHHGTDMGVVKYRRVT